MRKRGKKLLAMMLAMSMTMNVVSMQAFADEPVVETETQGPVDNGDGTATGTTITTTTTTDSETGNVTVNVEIKKILADTNEEDGVDVSGESTRKENTITDENGKLVEENWVEDGSEKKEWTEEDAGDGEQEEVEVPLVPGEEKEAKDIDKEITGDINSEEGQTTTTTTDRTVTSNTSEVQITVNDSASGLVNDGASGLKGLTPVYDETDEITYRTDGRISDASGKDGLFDRNYLSASDTDPSKWTDIPPEGEYRYVGTGEHSKYFVGIVKVIYKKDDAGNTLYDTDGNPIIEKLVNNVSGNDHTSNGEVLDEFVPEYNIDSGFSGSRAQNFMLMDKNGNRVYAYCCDVQTGANQGKWYKVSNLEDSEYYTPESEDQIRAIVMNGYWGTSDIAKADGTYETGSLEGIKDKLLKAVEAGEIERYVQVPVRDTSTEGAGKIQVDADGNPLYHEEKMDLLQIISGMTEGEALLATQAAIWSFANGSKGAVSGIDGPVVITPDWYRNHQPTYNKVENEPLDDAAGVRVAALYNWLMTLQPEEEKTIVINEKNFVEDMSLTVGDKVADHENNKDDNKDNDVYNTDLNFKLAFIPGANDDLLVQISYTDLDGKQVNVVKRLAGKNAEGQTYEDIKPEKDGSYVLRGLKLSENEDFNFDLRLEGTQYLEQGV